VATLLAAVAAVATSGYGSGEERLSLADQTFTLSPTTREYRSRFAVESNWEFQLDIEATTTTSAHPQLELRAIGDNATSVNIGSADDPPGYRASEARTLLSTSARADPCQFPCAAQFEVIVTSDASATSKVEGTLSITVSNSYSIGEDDEYLSIKPL
jgi:hypothetical protein